MAKRKHEEEHENHERWLVSYADFITLLFAFFVVMYSVSRVDVKKLAQTEAAIQWAMHFKGTGGVGAPPVFEGPQRIGGCVANLGLGEASGPETERAVESLRKKLDQRLHPLLLERKMPAVVVSIQGRTLAIRLAASHFFDPANAALRPEAIPVLDAIAAELVPLHRVIRIEGHTDSGTLTSTRFHDNWDLSAARAARVAAYLEQAHHAEPKNLAAVGLADSHPLVPNTTPEGRETNRRIELVLEIPPGDRLEFATGVR
jgi:chemotaxis protein MotB